jgi:hypothetical protein
LKRRLHPNGQACKDFQATFFLKGIPKTGKLNIK